MEICRKILRVISDIFIAICIIFLIAELIIIIKARIYDDKIPGLFGIKPMIVISSSMEDAINEGDIVFVKEVSADDLEVGDIISYRNSENTVTTHRIIEITYNSNWEKQFVTKGDNNIVADASYVSSSSIEGVYIGKIANVGSFLLYLQEPKGLLTTIVIVLVLGFIWIVADTRPACETTENKKITSKKTKKATKNKDAKTSIKENKKTTNNKDTKTSIKENKKMTNKENEKTTNKEDKKATKT